MDSMAVIRIEPGQTLNLDSCTVQAACNYMWDGIYVADSTATLNVTGEGGKEVVGNFVLMR
jgi:hypothetical protein